MNIRPSSSTGVVFALVADSAVPLSVAVVTQGEEEAVSSVSFTSEGISACPRKYVRNSTFDDAGISFPCLLQNLQVFLDGVSVATLDSLMLCYLERLTVHLRVTPTDLHISANSSTVAYLRSDALREALSLLNVTMQNPVSTYVGGIPG